MACKACQFRFCDRCKIPWVGDGSAYLGGKGAHGAKCLYRTRETESTHGLSDRYSNGDDTDAELQVDGSANVQGLAAKRKASKIDGDVDEDETTSKETVAKKQKQTKK